jgi:hypothetical protein
VQGTNENRPRHEREPSKTRNPRQKTALPTLFLQGTLDPTKFPRTFPRPGSLVTSSPTTTTKNLVNFKNLYLIQLLKTFCDSFVLHKHAVAGCAHIRRVCYQVRFDLLSLFDPVLSDFYRPCLRVLRPPSTSPLRTLHLALVTTTVLLLVVVRTSTLEAIPQTNQPSPPTFPEVKHRPGQSCSCAKGNEKPTSAHH